MAKYSSTLLTELRPGDVVLLMPSKTDGWKRIERKLVRIERVSENYSFLIFEKDYKLGSHHWYEFDRRI